MVAIREQLVTSTKNISVHPNDKRTITVHETGNRGRGAGAQAHANLQSRPNPRVASWHYQVDDDGAIRSFRHGVRTFHAGTALGNRESISVEICINIDQDQRQAYLNAAELVAWIARSEGIPLDRVVQHNRYSGKDCPDGLRNRPPLYGMGWDEFMGHVRRFYQAGATPTPGNPAPTYHPITTEQMEALALLGFYDGRLDGTSGPMTHAAVLAFQRAYGLHPDGLIGPITAPILTREATIMIQEILDAIQGARDDLAGIKRRDALHAGLELGFIRFDGPQSTVYAVEWDGTATPISNATWAAFRRSAEGARVVVADVDAAAWAGRINGTRV